jgi:RNA polymerase sigma-70 factor (ECF subfamily)
VTPRSKKPLDSHEHSSFVRAAIERHQAPLIRYASRLLGDPDLAQDVVQDTFVRLLAQKPEAIQDHLAEWLFTVCRNRVFDTKRKDGRMRHFAEGEVERVETSTPRPGKTLEAQETMNAILQMIEKLPANQQEVVRLKFQNGFSYKEISRITSLSVSNVGFLLHTAVKSLRGAWSQSKE